MIDPHSSLDEVQALRYLVWDDLYLEEKPYQVFMEVSRLESKPDLETTNVSFDSPGPELIRDVRGHENDFNLDDHGFAMVNHETTMTEFTDPEMINKQYLPEIENLLRKEINDVDRVAFFDWRLRKAAPLERADMRDPMQTLPPSPIVHNDISAAGALSRVHEETGTDAEELLKGRVRIINVWRPIKTPVEDWPLCLCDGSTASPQDLIECDHVRKDRQSSMLFPLPSTNYRWYYKSRQTRDEVTFIKTFDSDPKVRASSESSSD